MTAFLPDYPERLSVEFRMGLRTASTGALMPPLIPLPSLDGDTLPDRARDLW